MRIFDPLRVFRTHRSFFPTLRHHLGSSAGQRHHQPVLSQGSRALPQRGPMGAQGCLFQNRSSVLGPGQLLEREPFPYILYGNLAFKRQLRVGSVPPAPKEAQRRPSYLSLRHSPLPSTQPFGL